MLAKKDGLAPQRQSLWTFSKGGYPIPYSVPPFDIVELYNGKSIPREEKVLEYYDYDKCIVYNYNYDKDVRL